MSERTGQIITFYSYKGGTGRSMALANVACLLTQLEPKGKGVLMIDWDLEAPGLHRFFRSMFTKRFPISDNLERTLDEQPGLIDLFMELDAATLNANTTVEKITDKEIEVLLDQIKIEEYALETDIPGLFLIKAGRFDEAYATCVNTFQWVELYNRAPRLMSSLARRWAQQYGYVLIDSRTGISDTSGISTMIMPEKLVVVFTPNRQSLSGLASLVRQATDYRKESDDLRQLIVFPLPSRTERSEHDLLNYWRFGNPKMDIIGYQPLFEKLFEEVYDLQECKLNAYFDQVELQYVPYFSFGEEIAVLVEASTRASTSRLSLTSSYEYFVERLLSLDDSWNQYSQEEMQGTNIMARVEGHIAGITGEVVNVNIYNQLNVERQEQRMRLQAMLVDQSAFIRDRLDSFVGRERELEEIRHLIRQKLLTGGYITITGQAGQGKSSIIAKLVEEFGLENTSYHFIPFNPGPDHQVSLLRNLMASLILKYDLSDIYLASESRAALRDYFPKLLSELAAKGNQEVIFIDGLDQLQEENSGVRDLSFLPNNPPEGVIFVLGTRPNDSLRPLELLEPSYEYALPNLSRRDFDLILMHRKVHLDKLLADQFYLVMQENALYLDLVAKELAQRSAKPEEIIKRLADNPENIFSLSIVRLKRHAIEWREVIKPTLGVLLAAREPLAIRQIRQIINVEDDRLRDALERLGGLVAVDGQRNYSLFHLKLLDFLRQDENNPTKEYIFATDEVEVWHKRLAGWCEQGDISSIWQDVKNNPTEQRRREYARKHYIVHLYYAGKWMQLFEVLDVGQYGRAKVRYDPSTLSYAQDLDIGRQAAAWDGWAMVEGLGLLPYLWRYTLLRCSLASRADNYSLEAFEVLLLLGRKQEALGLAKLLTDPAYKVEVLMQIAKQLEKGSNREQESLLLFIRAHEVAISIDNKIVRAEALAELSEALVQAQQWERAEATWIEVEAISRSIEDSRARAEALVKLSGVLVHAQQWERAEVINRSIEDNEARVGALVELSSELAKAQQWERAEAISRSIEDSRARAETLVKLSSELAKAQQWERAEAAWIEVEAISRSIADSRARAEILAKLSEALVQAQQWERAEATWIEVEAISRSIEDSRARAEALVKLSGVLVHAQQWERAEVINRSIEDNEARVGALVELSSELAKAQQWDRAEAISRSIEDSRARAETLVKLSSELAKAQQWERANSLWTEGEAIIRAIEDSVMRAEALTEFNEAQMQDQKGEQAATTHLTVENNEFKVEELARAQQWEQAEMMSYTMENSRARAVTLRELARDLAHAREYERMLRLVQRAWLQADTREYAIKLLPLANGFIPLKPEIGMAFYEAFTWVDAFLRG